MLNRPDFRSLDSLEPFDDIVDMIKAIDERDKYIHKLEWILNKLDYETVNRLEAEFEKEPKLPNYGEDGYYDDSPSRHEYDG